ncbi:MAG: hypothetical protein AAGI03_00330 [Pseudomonadota bacterium]
MTFLRLWLPVFVLCLARPAYSEDPGRIGVACHGNAAEACYYVIDGLITQDLVSKAIEALEGGVSDTFKVLLNSDGGDLSAGIALGRAIRASGMETRVGIYRPMDHPLPGSCLSACAYAFLGGTQRILAPESQLGFHRFALDQGSAFQGDAGLVVGQLLSANVVSYIVEMGVDARLFTRAAETSFESMYFPDYEARVTFDVETPLGFDHFFLEPYGDGVVAAAKRLGPTHPYDRVDQVTVYCRGGRAYVLLSMLGKHPFAPDVEGASFEVRVSDSASPGVDDWQSVDSKAAEARTWTSTSGGFIEIAFDPRKLRLTPNTQIFAASFFRSRADGGNHSASVRLNRMDRQMLGAAFRLCI